MCRVEATFGSVEAAGVVRGTVVRPRLATAGRLFHMQRERDEREFDELSTEQKIEYVMALWDRIGAADDEVPVSDEILAELDRRIDEHDRNPELSVTWEELKLRIWGPNL